MLKSYEDELVVVFGGSGYVGSVLVRLLLQEGYRVRVVDNFLFGEDGLKGLDSLRLQIVEGDITDIKDVSSGVTGADYVILLSAIVGHRLRDIKWFNTRAINLLASTVVLDAAVEHGASRFLFASTDSVYGLQSGVMYETGTPEPVSLYSRLKLRMEERVLNKRQRSFHPVVLRIANCHGYSPRMRFDLVLNSLVRDAVCKKEITIRSADQWRSLIHVEDTARAFIACIKAHENLISGEIFNVGSSTQNIQINQLANIVISVVPETTVNFLETETEHSEYRLSCSKIEKVLDFSSTWSLEDSACQMRDKLIEGCFSDPYSLRYSNT